MALRIQPTFIQAVARGQVEFPKVRLRMAASTCVPNNRVRYLQSVPGLCKRTIALKTQYVETDAGVAIQLLESVKITVTRSLAGATCLLFYDTRTRRLVATHPLHTMLFTRDTFTLGPPVGLRLLTMEAF